MRTKYNTGDLVEIDNLGTDIEKRVGIVLGKLKPKEIGLTTAAFTYHKFLPEYLVLCNNTKLCFSYVFLKLLKKRG